MKYYLEDTDKVLRELESSEQGLSSGEAAARLQQNGKNVLIGTEKTPMWKKILETLTDPMIMILLAAAVVQVVVTILETKGHFTLGSFGAGEQGRVRHGSAGRDDRRHLPRAARR